MVKGIFADKIKEIYDLSVWEILEIPWFDMEWPILIFKFQNINGFLKHVENYANYELLTVAD